MTSVNGLDKDMLRFAFSVSVKPSTGRPIIFPTWAAKGEKKLTNKSGLNLLATFKIAASFLKIENAFPKADPRFFPVQEYLKP